MIEECDTKEYDSVQDVSILTTQLKQNLASWGLPDTILKVYVYVHWCIGIVILFQMPRLSLIILTKMIEATSAVHLPVHIFISFISY
jgi:hypothetical protein